MSDTDRRLVMTGTSSLTDGDLSPILGEQIGQQSTLRFGVAANNVMRSSLKVHQQAAKVPRKATYLQGRKMDSEQSNTRKDEPQDSASAITTDFGNWRSQQSL